VTVNATVKTPIPRRSAFDIYWNFAYERQAIFEARRAGSAGPWSEDPILQTFKFCNVYRAADRVSQYLIRHVCYADDSSSAADKAFQIVAFRTFSNIETWKSVVNRLGHNPTLDDLGSGRFERALDDTKADVGKLYTGAFILCATDAYGRRIKHHNHVELFKHMFLANDLNHEIESAESLKAVYDALHVFPLMGDFMSYQIAIDLNYSTLTDFSENDFTQPGPGALRGIKKVFLDNGGLSPRDVVMWMVDSQEREFERLGLDFKGLFGRPIQAIDAQNLFCETDKYCREALPELASARSRIKAKHNPSAEPIALFFPPKWGLNERIASETGLSIAEDHFARTLASS
jgi:hypothetical protein